MKQVLGPCLTPHSAPSASSSWAFWTRRELCVAPLRPQPRLQALAALSGLPSEASRHAYGCLPSSPTIARCDGRGTRVTRAPRRGWQDRAYSEQLARGVRVALLPASLASEGHDTTGDATAQPPSPPGGSSGSEGPAPPLLSGAKSAALGAWLGGDGASRRETKPWR